MTPTADLMKLVEEGLARTPGKCSRINGPTACKPPCPRWGRRGWVGRL